MARSDYETVLSVLFDMGEIEEYSPGKSRSVYQDKKIQIYGGINKKRTRFTSLAVFIRTIPEGDGERPNDPRWPSSEEERTLVAEWTGKDGENCTFFRDGHWRNYLKDLERYAEKKASFPRRKNNQPIGDKSFFTEPAQPSFPQNRFGRPLTPFSPGTPPAPPPAPEKAPAKPTSSRKKKASS